MLHIRCGVNINFESKLFLPKSTRHHIEKTDAGLNSLYIRDITVLYNFITMQNNY